MIRIFVHLFLRLCLAFICQDVKVQGEITREFATRLSIQYGSKIKVPDEYDDFEFPLHVITWQAVDKVRPWSDVVLVLKNLPPRMAMYALMRQDGFRKEVPLHLTAFYAPRSVIDRMLSLAKNAARVKDSDGWLPLHNAADINNVDAYEPLVNAYPNALLETNNDGNTPMDAAIGNGRGSIFLKQMFLTTACDARFQNYGTLLKDESLYNGSMNPVNIIMLECIHGKRSPKDVVEFFNQIQHKLAIFRALVHHTIESDMESSPGIYAHKIKFFNDKDRAVVMNALKNTGDNVEALTSHNASSGWDDSPDQEGPDRLITEQMRVLGDANELDDDLVMEEVRVPFL